MLRSPVRTARKRPAFALLVAVGTAGPVSGQELPSEPVAAAEPRPCVVVASDAGPQSSRQTEPQVYQQPPPAPTPEPEPLEARRKPMNEREVLELIETLEAAQGKLEPGQDKKAGVSSKWERASADRLRVVLDDVTALLVAVHAREAAHQFETAGRTGSETRQWVEVQAGRIQTCVSGRFDERGGAAAYRSSLALVEKHRSKLEPLVLGLGRWVPSGPSPGWQAPR